MALLKEFLSSLFVPIFEPTMGLGAKLFVNSLVEVMGRELDREDAGDSQPPKRARVANIVRDRSGLLDALYGMTDVEFKQFFRLDKEAFRHLVSLLTPLLTGPHSVARAVASSGSAVCVDVKLAVTLRFLAGGQWPDLKMCWKVAKPTLYASIWKVIMSLITIESSCDVSVSS